MINISGSAGTGKTKELVKVAVNNGATIVCESPSRLYDKIHGYGIAGLTCISYYDYLDIIMDKAENDIKNDKKFVIDDIGKFIEYLAPNTIAFTSLIED